MPRTAVATQGDGRPVVLIHGLGLDSGMWRHQVPALVTAGYLAVTCDLLGHGRSDKPSAAGTTYSAADLAVSLNRALDELGIGPAVLVGFSLGGAAALWTALHRAERVAGLVLANTSAWMGEDAPARFLGRADTVEREGVHTLVAPALERWFTPEFLFAKQSICQEYADAIAGNHRDGYAAACRALATFDVRSRLDKIRCPTLVLVGDRDQATPPAMAEVLRAGIPGARLRTLAPSGHLSTEECAEAFNAELLHFAADVFGPARSAGRHRS